MEIVLVGSRYNHFSSEPRLPHPAMLAFACAPYARVAVFANADRAEMRGPAAQPGASGAHSAGAGAGTDAIVSLQGGSDAILVGADAVPTAAEVSGGGSAKQGRSRRRRRLRLPAAEGVRDVGELVLGEELVGTVCDVGGAGSAWVDVGVRTSGGRAVRARLRLGGGAAGVVPGSVVRVNVVGLNAAAGRVEVRVPRRGGRNSVVTGRALETLETGERMEGGVVAVDKYGVLIDVGVVRKGRKGRVVACNGLLPRKNFPVSWASDADLVVRDNVERVLCVGDRVEVYVRAVHLDNGFLWFDAEPIDAVAIAAKAQTEKVRKRRRRWRKAPESLTIGDQREGVVCAVEKYGVFVDVGVTTDGLIHYTAMGQRHRPDWEDTVTEGTEVVVEVVNVARGRIGLRLLAIKGEALADAEEAALLPTARVADVERAAQLKLVAARGRDKRQHGLPSRTLARVPDVGDEVEVEDKEKEEENKGLDKFDDDYFEDKYGY